MALSKIMFQLSTYNVIFAIVCLVFKRYIPDDVLDVARGIALFVFIASFYFQLVYGVDTLADVFSARLEDPTPIEWVVITFGNVLWHALPLFILGIPKNLASILIAWVIIITWYFAIRKQICDVYTEKVTVTEYDVLVFGIVPACSAVVYGVRHGIAVMQVS